MSVSSGVTKLSVAQINDLITKFNSDAADRGITTRIPNISGESSSQKGRASTEALLKLDKLRGELITKNRYAGCSTVTCGTVGTGKPSNWNGKSLTDGPVNSGEPSFARYKKVIASQYNLIESDINAAYDMCACNSFESKMDAASCTCNTTCECQSQTIIKPDCSCNGVAKNEVVACSCDSDVWGCDTNCDSVGQDCTCVKVTVILGCKSYENPICNCNTNNWYENCCESNYTEEYCSCYDVTYDGLSYDEILDLAEQWGIEPEEILTTLNCVECDCDGVYYETDNLDCGCNYNLQTCTCVSVDCTTNCDCVAQTENKCECNTTCGCDNQACFSHQEPSNAGQCSCNTVACSSHKSCPSNTISENCAVNCDCHSHVEPPAGTQTCSCNKVCVEYVN